MKRICVIQASHKSWAGARDRCLRILDGEPALRKTIDRAVNNLNVDEVVVAVPEWNVEIQQALPETGDVRLYADYPDDPLRRVLFSAANADTVLRVDGFHALFEWETANFLMDRVEIVGEGCVKLPDDYPPMLACEAYDVEHLHGLDAMTLDELPPKYRTHFRFAPQLPVLRVNSVVEYSRDMLQRMRHRLCPVYSVGRDKVIATSPGDQLSFHYELALPWITENANVLDAACGEANAASLLYKKCGWVTAIDIDSGLIHELGGQNELPNVDYESADICELPYDQVFDNVLSFETVEHVLDYHVALFEFHRVLKPGGLLILSTPQAREPFGDTPINCSHEHEFSLNEFLRVTARAGFEKVDLKGIKGGRIIHPTDVIAPNMFYVGRKK